jgi:D-inositol-3-phosphate glycosyltransferase
VDGTEGDETAALPRRVAMLSVHTSPLDQPGGGDAGGLNVFVNELAKRLPARGVAVEMFTRATSPDLPPILEVEPGILVRHIVAGPHAPLAKDDLPAQLCAFTSGVLRAEAAHESGWFDLVHSHYWLSGQVGWLATQRWGVPFVHSMHTMARVKNSALAGGDAPEPRLREVGEQQVVDAADRLIANTETEVNQLANLYGADRDRIDVVPPGVDLEVFAPGSREDARRSLGINADDVVLLFAGRVQPLKAPDIVLRAAAVLLKRRPDLRGRLVVAIVGGLSGRPNEPESLVELTRSLGIGDIVRLVGPRAQPALADWYRAATITVVPSYSESFGLVALESQACGTPVVAADVGGLRSVVADGRSGVLVSSHVPEDWADRLQALIDSPGWLRVLGAGALDQAAKFGWDDTAAGMLDVYTRALENKRARVLAP